MSVTSEGVKTAKPAAAPPRNDALFRRYASAGLISIVGGLLLWELVSRFLIDNALFLAAPSQIAVAIYNLAITGQLWHHIAVSGIEFVVGYVSASALAIPLGLAMASSHTV